MGAEKGKKVGKKQLISPKDDQEPSKVQASIQNEHSESKI